MFLSSPLRLGQQFDGASAQRHARQQHGAAHVALARGEQHQVEPAAQLLASEDQDRLRKTVDLAAAAHAERIDQPQQVVGQRHVLAQQRFDFMGVGVGRRPAGPAAAPASARPPGRRTPFRGAARYQSPSIHLAPCGNLGADRACRPRNTRRPRRPASSRPWRRPAASDGSSPAGTKHGMAAGSALPRLRLHQPQQRDGVAGAVGQQAGGLAAGGRQGRGRRTAARSGRGHRRQARENDLSCYPQTVNARQHLTGLWGLVQHFWFAPILSFVKKLMNRESTMLEIRRSEERGDANHGWLQSKHTFSFGELSGSAPYRFRPPAGHQRGPGGAGAGLRRPWPPRHGNHLVRAGRRARAQGQPGHRLGAALRRRAAHVGRQRRAPQRIQRLRSPSRCISCRSGSSRMSPTLRQATRKSISRPTARPASCGWWRRTTAATARC